MEHTTFGWALEQLRSGNQVTRAGWNGKGQFVELQVPDEHSKMTLPYLYIVTVTGHRVPWLASQTDMLADDWFVVGLAHTPPAPAPEDRVIAPCRVCYACVDTEDMGRHLEWHRAMPNIPVEA